MKSILSALSVVGSAFVFLSGFGFQPTTEAMAAPAPLQVGVAKPIRREVIDYEYREGRTSPAESVEIKARVSGHITTVMFEAGRGVVKGDFLFEIDPRAYVAERDVALAELAQAKASQARLAADKLRADKLRASNNISRQDYDKILASCDDVETRLKTAQAKLDAADLNLRYTKLVTPINGRAGKSTVKPGDLIKADETTLTTIVRDDPMYVGFDLSDAALLRWMKLVSEDKRFPGKNSGPPVWIEFPNEKGFPHQGFIDVLSNTVDQATGLVQLRGIFQNPRGEQGAPRIASGIVVRVRVAMSKPYTATLVSDRAIATDGGAKVVFVVDEQGIARRREVKLGDLHDGLRVVTSGLGDDDRVIVTGEGPGRDGTRVSAMLVPMPSEAQPKMPAAAPGQQRP